MRGGERAKRLTSHIIRVGGTAGVVRSAGEAAFIVCPEVLSDSTEYTRYQLPHKKTTLPPPLLGAFRDNLTSNTHREA